MKIEFRARKILSPLFQFENFEEKDASAWAGRLGARDDEILCGIYRNEAGDTPESVVVSSKGMHLLDGLTHEFIPYDSIKAIGTPTKATEDRTLHIQLVDARRFTITISGRLGRMKDIFEFLRFLRRVTNAQGLPTED